MCLFGFSAVTSEKACCKVHFASTTDNVAITLCHSPCTTHSYLLILTGRLLRAGTLGKPLPFRPHQKKKLVYGFGFSEIGAVGRFFFQNLFLSMDFHLKLGGRANFFFLIFTNCYFLANDDKTGHKK